MNETHPADPAVTVDTLRLAAAELRVMGPHLRLSAPEITAESWGNLGGRFREVMNAAAMASANIGVDTSELAEDYRVQCGVDQPSVLRRPLTHLTEDGE